MRTIDAAFGMEGGYVLGFSDRTMAEFFEDEFGLDLNEEKYTIDGSSKARRLRAFIRLEEPQVVAPVLRGLWKQRGEKSGDEEIKAGLFEIIERMEGGSAIPRTDAIDRFKRDETLEELISAIERDVAANKPAAALDRLHTYCMKKFAHLLEERGIAFDKSDPLQSRVGKYVRALERDREIREITRRAIKASISIFDAFNEVRNTKSFAHDNELVDQAEARFIFDTISALLRLLKTVDTDRFGA